MIEVHDRAAREVANEISILLSRMGVFFRIFARCKTEVSTISKIASKNYGPATKRMQDVIGVRVTLYFSDDVDIVKKVLIRAWRDRYVTETVDEPNANTFHPRRLNLIARLRPEHAEWVALLRDHKDEIEDTFELQLRTVLSEGWHEVEHDLRYKEKQDWDDVPEMSRVLNGVLASLENCDWSMLQLFERLAHRHYKLRQWSPMIRNKYRLRGLGGHLSEPVLAVLARNPVLAKSLVRGRRDRVLLALASDAFIPVTPDNLVFLFNHIETKDAEVAALVPPPLLEQFRRIPYSSFPVDAALSDTLSGD